MAPAAKAILEPDATVWRVAQADRVAVLVDAAAYYGALRETLLAAERSVFIVGWDVDSRTPLVGSESEPADGAPAQLGPLLDHVVQRRPELSIHILLWDFSILYALEREPLPAINLDWKTPPQVQVCLDDVLPLGASHHQKLVVVDDAVAFCGGLDLTIRRWDTSRHAADDPNRRDPAGQPYDPFHDVQLAVTGDAAAALGELVRERWLEANCRRAVPLAPSGDPWPSRLAADFESVQVGIARTVAPHSGRPSIREVEALYARAVGTARRWIYIENQFISSVAVADALIARLEENQGLEVLVVCPRQHHSWLEDASMGFGRRQFRRRIHEAGFEDRIRFFCPVVPDGDEGERPVMVHAKLMVIDDAYLQVGSANLNNRSMGLDTECDVGLEARSDAERERIAAVRNRLLAEHLDARPEEVASGLERTGSILETVASLGRGRRRLAPIEDPLDAPVDDIPVVQAVGTIIDPERPVSPKDFVDRMLGEDRSAPVEDEPSGRRRGLWRVAAVAGVLVGLALVWKFTPLAEWTDPDRAVPWLQEIAASRWSMVIVPGAYVVGGLVLFPLTVLIAVTAAVFGPWSGGLYALVGSLLSAAASYGLGFSAGRRPLRTLMGKRLNRVSRAIAKRGILAVAALRLVPVAPYTVVNVVAGATHIKFRDFIAGTALGLAPGIVVLTVLGDRLRRLWEEPSAEGIALLAVALVAWIALAAGAQALVNKLQGRGSESVSL